MNQSYPKPGEAGGKIIRSMKTSLKAAGISTPITSHILIAFSGGADSTALAVALLKYGRRIASSEKIQLLHVVHGWDVDKSKTDLQFVRDFARRWNADLIERSAEPPPQGVSWENWGREQRTRIFRELAKDGAWVLTAHTGDDVAETHLWRFLSGVWRAGEVGIRLKHEQQLRPLLRVRKSELVAFLGEEKECWIEDPFNEDERFQRVFLRKKVLPVIEEKFPKAISNLMKYSQQSSGINTEIETLKQQFKEQGLRVTKGTWNEISDSMEDADFAVDLPGGYRLTRSHSKTDKKNLD